MWNNHDECSLTDITLGKTCTNVNFAVNLNRWGETPRSIKQHLKIVFFPLLSLFWAFPEDVHRFVLFYFFSPYDDDTTLSDLLHVRSSLWLVRWLERAFLDISDACVQSSFMSINDENCQEEDLKATAHETSALPCGNRSEIKSWLLTASQKTNAVS